jgi:hypothetical protein
MTSHDLAYDSINDDLVSAGFDRFVGHVDHREASASKDSERGLHFFANPPGIDVVNGTGTPDSCNAAREARSADQGGWSGR